eukprot:3466505-Prymnesium_polylepis.1
MKRTVSTFGEVGDKAVSEAECAGTLHCGEEKWIGGVLTANGKILGIPYSAESVLEIDPVARTATTFGVVTAHRTPDLSTARVLPPPPEGEATLSIGLHTLPLLLPQLVHGQAQVGRRRAGRQQARVRHPVRRRRRARDRPREPRPLHLRLPRPLRRLVQVVRWRPRLVACPALQSRRNRSTRRPHRPDAVPGCALSWATGRPTS